MKSSRKRKRETAKENIEAGGIQAQNKVKKKKNYV
jgi:hypothetical protein